MDRLKQLKFNPFNIDTDILNLQNIEKFLTENLEYVTCNYHLANDFSTVNDENKNLTILNLNIRSIANKFDAFKHLLNTLMQPFSIISLTDHETGLMNKSLSNYNFVCSNRVNKRGGGLGIYVSNDLHYKLRPDLNINEDGIIETLFIEINSTTGKNNILSNIYRPPSGNFEIFENKLNDILSEVDKTKKITHLMGDFNIDLLKTDNCYDSNRFCEQLLTSSFFPLINRPTRITQHTATLIDNIFTNDLEQIESGINGLIFSDISDHLPIFHISSLSTNKNKSKTVKTRYKRTINNDSLASFLVSVKNISWSHTFQTNDPCESYDIFHNNLKAAIDKNFPFVKMKNKSFDHEKSSGVTGGVFRSISKKNRLRLYDSSVVPICC